MNQTFSLRRFTQMNRWFWAANGRTYSLAMLGIALATVFLLARVLTFTGYDSLVASNNLVYFKLASITAISLFSSHIINVLHDQQSAIPYLMLPASKTEKFTLIGLYFSLFIISYGLFYLCTEAILFQFANNRLPSTGNVYHSDLFRPQTEWLGRVVAIVRMLLLIAVVGLLGSLYFRQGVVVKNTVLIFGLFAGLTLLYSKTMSVFFPGQETHISHLLGDLYVSPRGQLSSSELPAPYFITQIFPWFLLLALWITARIRFNEIER